MSSAATAAAYRHWASVETHGSSPVYERLALAVADDEAVLDLLQQVPEPRRQPNLLFGALRWYGAPVEVPAAALTWLVDHRELVLQVLRTRRTQTNEAGRCAVLLPALAQLASRSPGPLAVVEVGASAGLCLLYDAWRYHYTGAVEHGIGPLDAVTLTCALRGPVPLPAAVPPITWRAGLDLHPVDPRDPDARRWLQALVWPEHADRAARLGAALDAAATARPDVRTGDMTADLAPLLEEAHRVARTLSALPPTVVVTHTAALVYLDSDQRRGVLETIRAAGAHRLGAEGGSVLPAITAQVPAGLEVGGRFVVSLDDRALALADPHGRSLTWW